MIDTTTTPSPAGATDVKPSELRSLWALTKYPFLAMMRNVSTFAFGFLFPIVFIAVFGLIGNGSGGGLRLGITSESAAQPAGQTIAQLSGVTPVQGSSAELEKQLQLGKLEGIVDVQGSRVVLQVNSASPQGQVARLWIQSTIDQLNLAALAPASLPYSLDVTQVAGRRDRYIDFALPGQIGFALLSTAIFGTVFGLLYLKKALILKRLFATPVHGITILLGQGLARLVMAVLQVLLILGVGVIGFGFQLANGWVTFVEMVLLSVLGLFVFLGFGLFIAGRTNDENAASPITNLVTLPQFLLSGVFFSTDVFPGWVQAIANVLPLTLFNSAMRQIAAEGVGLGDVLPAILGLCVWAAIAYAATARTFKWV
ncbi:MAG: type transport system permease protein [Chloroflexota bacterium]|jgi:ABC-2 type transport system permease protein|nr:type transport system permease protein [Chloroflexota bacterium]